MAKKKDDGIMKVLMVITYKGYAIYIRMVDKKIFIWDVIFENQLFSSFIVITPKLGEKGLNEDEIKEVIKMCYAGAAATVDNLLGVELSEKDKDMLEKFESAKTQIEGEA
jgi:hypothetical protein